MKKRNIVRFISALAVAFSLCVPAYAAQEQGTQEQGTQEVWHRQPYAPYSVTVSVYSGVTAYTGSGTNYTGRALVTLESVKGSNPTTAFNVATYNWNSARNISGTYKISKPSDNIGWVQIDTNASNHPGENIRAGFWKSNVNTSYQISGKFYHDGL